MKILSHDFSNNQCLERLHQLAAACVYAWCSGNPELENAILEVGLEPNEMRQVVGNNRVWRRLYFALVEALKHDDRKTVKWLIPLRTVPSVPCRY